MLAGEGDRSTGAALHSVSRFVSQGVPNLCCISVGATHNQDVIFGVVSPLQPPGRAIALNHPDAMRGELAAQGINRFPRLSAHRCCSQQRRCEASNQGPSSNLALKLVQRLWHGPLSGHLTRVRHQRIKKSPKWVIPVTRCERGVAQATGCIKPPPGDESSSSFSVSFCHRAKIPRAAAPTKLPRRPRELPVAIGSMNSATGYHVVCLHGNEGLRNVLGFLIFPAQARAQTLKTASFLSFCCWSRCSGVNPSVSGICDAICSSQPLSSSSCRSMGRTPRPRARTLATLPLPAW